MSIWNATYKSLNRPLVIAHRGGTNAARENTRAAFEACLKAGADVIETDLRLTRDGVPVCLHDEHLSHPSQSGEWIEDITFQALHAIDPDVPRFEDVSPMHPAFYLDIKEKSVGSQIAILRALHATNGSRDWIVGVGSVELADAISERFPNLRQVCLMVRREEISAFAKNRSDHWVRVHEPRVSAELLSSFRNEGLRIMITCGGDGRATGEVGVRELKRIATFEPDALIVNDPALVMRSFTLPSQGGLLSKPMS